MNSTQNRSRADLDTIRTGFDKSLLGDVELSKKLLELKIVARVPTDAPNVYCKDGLMILARIAFDQGSTSCPLSSLEAAKVIANALLLRDDLQVVFASLGFTDNLIAFYRTTSPDHEFVGARILFLLTYKGKVDFVHLIENKHLVQSIKDKLVAHLDIIAKQKFASSPMIGMALTESLKLLYNVANKCPEQMSYHAQTVNALAQIITKIGVEDEPLTSPISQLLNALAIIEWSASAEKDLIEVSLPLARRLIHVTDLLTKSTPPAELENQMVPLLTVIRKVNFLYHDKTQQYLKVSLLPRDEERNQPLGKSQTLASRLLRLQTSGGLTNLPEAISQVLFELSDSDASKFVHNIGYGHAAGYLMTHKIQIPPDLGAAANASVNSINPITGQRLDAESPVNMPEMTDEEKEREAERLFVLFERLQATGVVSAAENPMRVAQQSGRFEELPDDD